MYCLRYWARYVRKGEVKSGGIKIGNESIIQFLVVLFPLGNNFVRPIEPINRLIQTQSKLQQFTIHKRKK